MNAKTVKEAVDALAELGDKAKLIAGGTDVMLMIRDGKKAEYVKSFTVAGNFYDLLKNITALANNCHLPRAMGMTTFGAPSVLVDGLTIAGK